MRKLFLNEKHIPLYNAGLILLIAGISFWTAASASVHAFALVMFGCSLALAFLGLFYGTNISLKAAVAIMAVTGSVYAYMQVFMTHVTLPSASELFAWLGVIGVAGFLPGRIGQWTSALWTDYTSMYRQFQGMVTVDPETGFDNKQRFFFEVEEAFKRAERYQHHFTLLLVRIAYFEHFKKLYGPREAQYLVQSVARVLRERTRSSDRKFRLEEDLFAVLLVKAADDAVFTVMNHLERYIRTHVTEDQTIQVTITVEFGYAEYDGNQFSDYRQLIQHAFDELIQYVQ